MYNTRNVRIQEKLDRLFGNGPQAAELKAIALKAQTEGFSEEEMREYWENKEREIAELKERMPCNDDLALPVESITYYGPPPIQSNLIVNGTFDVSGERENGGCKNPAIKHEVVCGYASER